MEQGQERGEEGIKSTGDQVSFGKVWEGHLFILDRRKEEKDTYSKRTDE